MSEKATFDKIKYGSCKCDKGNTARGQHKCPYKFILFKTETICTCCFECENECLYDLSSELLSIIEGRENCENEEDTFNKLAYGMCNGLSFRTAFCNNISFGVHECTASEHYKVKECNCCIECAKRCTTYKNTLEKLIKELEHADQAEAEGNHE